MNRRGVALIAVLWLVTALASVAGVSLALARSGSRTSRNREVLARAGWAREACAEILLTRYAEHREVRGLDTIDLGRGAWCRADVTDPAAALNVNLASPDALRRVLHRTALVDAVLDWRDPDDLERPEGAEAAWYSAHGRSAPRNGAFADVAELALVRGFDDTVRARVAASFTTRGDGRINPLIAPADVVSTLPGVDASAAEVIVRAGAARAGSLDGWIATAPVPSRRAMLSEYRVLASAVTFSSGALIVTVRGGIRGFRPTSAVILTVAPVADRLAVIRREVM